VLPGYVTILKELEVSDGCRGYVWQLQIVQLCREEFDKFCKSPPAGQSRGQCIKQHAEELSPQCKKALSRRSQRFRTEGKTEVQTAPQQRAAEKPAGTSAP
jgi:hypothetical protein